MRPPASRRLHAKTERVMKKLEQFLGIPVQSADLPSPLDMLIATILSQNTNDKNSHRAYTLLKQKYPTWDALARTPLRSLRETIRTGGMANQKARRIKDTLAAVKKKHGAYDLSVLHSYSDDRVVEELTQLKGVGLKTASCVLLFSMGRDAFPVDTHVQRLCSRLGLAPGSRNPERTCELMGPLVPAGKRYSFHTNLIRIGRKICRSNNPACDLCPLYRECVWEGKKRRSKPRSPSTADHDFMLLDNIPA